MFKLIRMIVFTSWLAMV